MLVRVSALLLKVTDRRHASPAKVFVYKMKRLPGRRLLCPLTAAREQHLLPRCSLRASAVTDRACAWSRSVFASALNGQMIAALAESGSGST